MEEKKKNKSNDIFLFIILVPLGISLFTWISIEVDQFAFYMNSLMQENVLTLKLLDFLTPLFPTSDFPFREDETKVKITFLAMSIIIFPISIINYFLVKFIKKIKTNKGKK